MALVPPSPPAPSPPSPPPPPPPTHPHPHRPPPLRCDSTAILANPPMTSTMPRHTAATAIAWCNTRRQRLSQRSLRPPHLPPISCTPFQKVHPKNVPNMGPPGGPKNGPRSDPILKNERECLGAGPPGGPENGTKKRAQKWAQKWARFWPPPELPTVHQGHPADSGRLLKASAITTQRMVHNCLTLSVPRSRPLSFLSFPFCVSHSLFVFSSRILCLPLLSLSPSLSLVRFHCHLSISVSHSLSLFFSFSLFLLCLTLSRFLFCSLVFLSPPLSLFLSGSLFPSSLHFSFPSSLFALSLLVSLPKFIASSAAPKKSPASRLVFASVAPDTVGGRPKRRTRFPQQLAA